MGNTGTQDTPVAVTQAQVNQPNGVVGLDAGSNVVLAGGLTTNYPIHNGGGWFPKVVFPTPVTGTDFVGDYTDDYLVFQGGTMVGSSVQMHGTEGQVVHYVNESDVPFPFSSADGGTVDGLASRMIGVGETHAFRCHMVGAVGNWYTVSQSIAPVADTGWTNLTLINSWAALGSTPRVRKLISGLVVMEGVIFGGSAIAFAALPAGYYPSQTVDFMAPSLTTTPNTVAVPATGNLTVAATGTGSTVPSGSTIAFAWFAG